MKYPMLIVGIILFTLFITDDETGGHWRKFAYRYIPNTCKSIVDRSQKDLPDDWSLNCPGTEKLIINIDLGQTKKTTLPEIRREAYKTLANAYSLLANKTNIETLELLLQLHINIIHPRINIYSQSSGKECSKLHQVNDKVIIASYLKQGVKVREQVKD